MLNYNAYDSAIKQLYAEMSAEDDRNDEITNNDEWEKANAATAEKYIPRITALEKTRAAIANATQPRNDWFTEFCESLRNNQTLTTKQISVFAKYAKSEQTCRYKTPVETFRTIVNGKLFTVSNVGRKVTIEVLTLI